MQRSHFRHIRAILVVAMLGLALLGTMFGTADSVEARRRAAIDRGACEGLGGNYCSAVNGDFWNWNVVESEECDLPGGRSIGCDTRYDIGGRQIKQNCFEW